MLTPRATTGPNRASPRPAGLAPDLPGLDWRRLALPLARAEDALARLDERIEASPIRDGFLARAHFADARDALWLEGELVPLEDLVLHDAGMDARAPTHALTRAHDALRERRRIAARPPDWPFSEAGLAALRGESPATPTETGDPATPGRAAPRGEEEGPLAQALADLDVALDRAARALAGGPRGATAGSAPAAQSAEEETADAPGAWRAGLAATAEAPPALAAALALDSFDSLAPLGRRSVLGPALAAALLRQRGKTVGLLALGAGLRAVPRERRRAADPNARLAALLAAFAAAAETGRRDHARWMSARAAMLRKAESRRAGSRLGEAVDAVLAAPLVTAGTLAAALDVTPRAALDLIKALGLRETTGRGRYRAWAVL